jgi:uncharacterized protein YbcI
MDGTETSSTHGGQLLSDISNAMVALHKEQFGRGPTRARTHFAGPDILVCVLDDVLLPAEHALVAMGEQMRVEEARLFMQRATEARFVEMIERIAGRKVHSFASASDPERGIVMEICVFEPIAPSHDGDRE